MDTLLNQLDDNLKELYRKALDADAMLDNLQQQGHGKHQRIFADNTLFQASSNRFMPYLAETVRILIYVNTHTGECEHPDFPALGSVPF